MMKKNLEPAPRARRHAARAFSPFAAALSRRSRDDRGASLVETAIAAFVVILLLFGVFDMSLAFYAYHYVSDAAREGSRWAIVRGSRSCIQTPNLSDCNATGSEITAYVKGLNYPGIDSSKMDVTAAWLCQGTVNGSTGDSWAACDEGTTQNAPGNQVQVSVTYHFPLNIPFWSQTTLNVGSTSAMVISQ
jgi:Flp pilus assembly protein TadG